MAPIIKAPSGGSFARVCLGGTFDTIHDGHKKLLGEALSVCTESLTVGVTDESMIQKKILWELIKPVEERVADVREYLESQVKALISEGRLQKPLDLNIVPISDPFGPAITDASLEAIVVSDETIRGGEKINEIRHERGMSDLDIISISLLPDEKKESSIEEEKISSSSLRIRKLGTLLREPTNIASVDEPYLIGLTGGIAAGKSNIASDLESFGAGVIDCDKVAHQSYHNPGSPLHQKVLEEFGSDILDPRTQHINRTKLGAKVFGNPSLKSKLESLVWPATNQLVKQEVERLKLEEKRKVIVMEAALLIEAKWHEQVNQVWVSIIPPEEAIKRVMTRNNLSEEDAKKRVASQMTNKERVSHAHVVFCTLWDREITRAQVQKAWVMLNKRFIK